MIEVLEKLDGEGIVDGKREVGEKCKAESSPLSKE